jgi:two-component system, cell cycle response regulator DivK
MKKVLVVDDNPVSRELIREVLEAPDLEILEVPDGKAALQSIAELHPDVVLMDIQMPVLDGFAALRELRKDPSFRKLPVLAVTAFAMRGDREKAQRAGFDAYITKPIDGAELERLVRAFLGGQSNEAVSNGI